MNEDPPAVYEGSIPDPPRKQYSILDRSGVPKAIHEHVRDPKTGDKQCYWKLPDGTPSLNGTPLEDLPLYGEHELDDEAVLTVVVEGEKARDALAEALEDTEINVVGTVTGASNAPSPAVLEALGGHEVILWPDADGPGLSHMARIAERLDGIAAAVRVYQWHEAPEKGDAADHPAVISGNEKAIDRLLNDLCGAPEYVPVLGKKTGMADENGHRLLQGRVLLGEFLKGGIEPTPQLIEGLLYEGRVHSIASGTGTGKTILAEWMALRVMNEGRPILYLDAENGPKVIAERLQEMGADLDTLDHLFHYYPADLTLDPGSIEALLGTVEDVEPALVVFDSLADFLGMAGAEENSNTDVTRWFTEVVQPLKDLGVASLILDHVPKTGKGGPRGASSKVAKMDVQWELEVEIPFSRSRTGEIELKLTKDREAWLPKIVRFSIGGGVFARSHGTIEEPTEGGQERMTESASTVFDALKKAGEDGARWTDLERAANGSKGTVTRGLKELGRYNLVAKDNGRYFLKDEVPRSGIGITNSEGTDLYHIGTAVQNGTGNTESCTTSTSPPLGGGTSGTTEAQTNNDAEQNPIRRYLEDPAPWLLQQLERCRENEAIIGPTCSTISYEVFGTAARYAEVRPFVEEVLAERRAARGEE